LIGTLFVALMIFLLATFPATWLLMLFLGNMGLGLSYWGTLPLGILVSALLAAASQGRSSEQTERMPGRAATGSL